MAVFSLSALADRVKYLESQGMSREEAEKRAFGESNFTQNEQIMREFDRLYNNEHMDSEKEGDRERLINRNEAATNQNFDSQPEPQHQNNEYQE